MSTALTYFVHATSTDNEARVRSGWNDPDLSSTGVDQAHKLRELVANSSFDVVYCSDLRRAVHTASIAFPNSSLRQDARLREMNYGKLNGQPEHQFRADEDHWINNAFTEGESCTDIEKRVHSFLQENVSAGINIAVVSHRFPQLALEVLCNGMSWQEALQNDWRKTGEWQPGFTYEWS